MDGIPSGAQVGDHDDHLSSGHCKDQVTMLVKLIHPLDDHDGEGHVETCNHHLKTDRRDERVTSHIEQEQNGEDEVDRCDERHGPFRVLHWISGRGVSNVGGGDQVCGCKQRIPRQ